MISQITFTRFEQFGEEITPFSKYKL